MKSLLLICLLCLPAYASDDGDALERWHRHNVERDEAYFADHSRRMWDALDDVDDDMDARWNLLLAEKRSKKAKRQDDEEEDGDDGDDADGDRPKSADHYSVEITEDNTDYDAKAKALYAEAAVEAVKSGAVTEAVKLPLTLFNSILSLFK